MKTDLILTLLRSLQAQRRATIASGTDSQGARPLICDICELQLLYGKMPMLKFGLHSETWA